MPPLPSLYFKHSGFLFYFFVCLNVNATEISFCESAQRKNENAGPQYKEMSILSATEDSLTTKHTANLTRTPQ